MVRTSSTQGTFIEEFFFNNGGKYKMNKIDWCEGVLQLADIATNNVGDNDLNPKMKYIMESLENWERTLVQEG